MNTKASILLVLCVSLTILSGVLRGMVDQRWGVSEEMEQAAQRVEALPEQIGNWNANQIQSLDADAAKMLRCAGSTVRSYVHTKTGEAVSLIFLVGPAGPLAIHTPEVCYGASTFTTVEPRQQTVITDVNGGEHPFSVITFAENRVGQRLQRVYYSWNRDGKWVAPDSPRTSFAGAPMLYKVQIATNAVGKNAEMDAAERFISENLSVWKDICR